MSKYFSPDQTLLQITDKYPQTIDIFASNGFAQIADESKRKSFGKSINLKTALSLKGLSLETFSHLLDQAIEMSEQVTKVSKDAIKIEGLLPCPVRIPLNEKLDEFIKSYDKCEISYDLKAASMGVDWLKERLLAATDDSAIPDLFISAGFDMFFDEQMIGKYKNADVFKNMTSIDRLNPLFDNDAIDLKDPKKHYSMIAVVPAIFLVNEDELGDIPAPESWEDLLKSEFENKVSLPIGDFDLFNAILLHLNQLYGEESISILAKSLLKSMHPSEMVKSHKRKTEIPAVTIMPYFFTKMVMPGSGMRAVWPKDGAIVSPIFLLSKKEKEDKLKPIVDFFLSKEVGEILAHKGLFPSVNPDIDNRIPEQNKFMWLGWDYIYKNDIGKLLEKCNEVFNSALVNKEF